MQTEQNVKNGWERVLESQPSNLFACIYGGPFAQQLGINRAAINTFLGIAALNGLLLLGEDRYRPPQTAPDLNPDGSITGKGILGWGDKPQSKERDGSDYYQVNMGPTGWSVLINGELIMEELVRRNTKGAREIGPRFAGEFNRYLNQGLKVTLLRDVIYTLKKDSYFLNEIFGPFLLNTVLIIDFNNLRNPDYVRTVERLVRDEGWTDDDIVRSLSIPVEIERCVRGLGYLEWLRFTRQPLVGVAR